VLFFLLAVFERRNILDPAEEKRELLSNLIVYMDSFETGVQGTVTLFQEGSIEQAKLNTVQVIDGLSWIMEGIAVLRDLVAIDVTALKNTLVELQTCLENDDDVSTSDLFENELLPVVSSWKQRMKEVDGQRHT
jgi:hypothetical protein